MQAQTSGNTEPRLSPRYLLAPPISAAIITISSCVHLYAQYIPGAEIVSPSVATNPSPANPISAREHKLLYFSAVRVHYRSVVGFHPIFSASSTHAAVQLHASCTVRSFADRCPVRERTIRWGVAGGRRGVGLRFADIPTIHLDRCCSCEFPCRNSFRRSETDRQTTLRTPPHTYRVPNHQRDGRRTL